LIVSIGNLIVGGSGKTPVTIALAKRFKNAAVILRGYGRESKGLIVVKDGKKILSDVKRSGDEALEYALSLDEAIVIVSEDRKEAIVKAKELGAKIVFLDDGHSKYSIKKIDVLIKPNFKLPNSFCLPAGPYRHSISEYNEADFVLKEGVDFKRRVIVPKKEGRAVVITTISKPWRLKEFLPKNCTILISFKDHEFVSKEKIEKIIKEENSDFIYVTMKDFVKIKDFGFKVEIIKLEIEFLNQGFLDGIKQQD
jgi:tetraacyldisaccharide 4'-kinase